MKNDFLPRNGLAEEHSHILKGVIILCRLHRNHRTDVADGDGKNTILRIKKTFECSVVEIGPADAEFEALNISGSINKLMTNSNSVLFTVVFIMFGKINRYQFLINLSPGINKKPCYAIDLRNKL